MPVIIDKCKLLVGEGARDVEFFEALLKNMKIGDVRVLQCEGKGNLRQFVHLAAKDPMFVGGHMVSLLLTRDADTSAVDGFRSVCGALRAAGLPAPSEAGNAVPRAPGRPKVGVFILPDNKVSGSLETLCLRAIQDRSEAPCLDEYFRCAEEKAGLKPGSPDKGRVQAWLALQEHPDLHVGRASQKGYWPFDHPAFDALKRFLREMFSE